MTAPERREWIMTNRCRADDAIRVLDAAKRQRVSEYDERLRKVRGFAEVLFIKQTDEQQELFKPDEILSPDLEKLMSAPLRGLD